MDAVAVDGKRKCGEESLCCGEDVSSRHLREPGSADCGPEGGGHVEPVHVMVKHLHGCLGVYAETGPINKVHSSVGVRQEVALHGQADICWGVSDRSSGVDSWGCRAGGGKRSCDSVHQWKHHVPRL